MKRTGFTLVEILIVVIILGILAAIVVPQFTDASNEARMSSLTSDLQTVRGQVELYKMQHMGNNPQEDAVTHTTHFWTQLTTKTDDAGAAGGDLGPYLQMAPGNPFRASNGEVPTGVVPGAPPVDNGTDGWSFDTDTETFGAFGTGGNGEDLTLY